MTTEENRLPGQEENLGNNNQQEITASAVQEGNEVMSVTVKEDGTITTAISESDIAGGDSDKKENVADSFKGLPMRDLIASPLIAACEAQLMLSQAAFQYMKEIGFSDDAATKTRMLEFTLDRPVETPEGIQGAGSVLGTGSDSIAFNRKHECQFPDGSHCFYTD